MSPLPVELTLGLSDQETVALLALGTTVTLRRGEHLFRLGDAADAVYVVEQGRVSLTLPMRIRDGEEEVVVEEKNPGETVGWSGLVPPHRFTLNATAALPSELRSFTRAVLLEHFRSRPAVGYLVTSNLAAVMGHRLQVFQTMWLREMQRTVEHRYA
ncbi:MAG TPA: cyclic nucleotide-binding domain-containing protein [Vicinamibacteria bacterium]|nr:cyclic nucleotide-binding domain-containing protein [Vicinamibacteria bacterium]